MPSLRPINRFLTFFDLISSSEGISIPEDKKKSSSLTIFTNKIGKK